MGKFRDEVTNRLDKAGLANPFEVVNEALGGETREESRVRRAAAAASKPATVTPPAPQPAKKKDQAMRKGGYVKSADGCAIRGKTKGRII
jgi:hypothetical protein